MSETEYSPSYLASLVGGVQWALTAMTVFVNLETLYISLINVTGAREGSWSIDFRVEYALVIGIALIMGYLWVNRRTMTQPQEARELRQRIEYLMWMLFGWPLSLVVLDSVIGPIGLSPMVWYLSPLLLGFGGPLVAVVLVYVLEIDIVTKFGRYGREEQQA